MLIDRKNHRPEYIKIVRNLLSFISFGVLIGFHLFNSNAFAHDDIHGRPHFKGVRANPTAVMKALQNDQQGAQALAALSNTACVGGSAGGYSCNNIDLLSFMPLSDIGGGGPLSSANDIWGWTDTASGREFALVGRNDGTAFVEITDPINPLYLGMLPTHTDPSSWRDIKVFADHAFIVSEASGHGMQVFDLTRLVNADPLDAPYVFDDDAQYNGFGNAHNIVINEDSEFAYAVGTSTCSGGLHMVNISNPIFPTDAGCFSGDGYTHDAQCVRYSGPDSQYQGQGSEICFAANEDTLTIVDVTNKANPVQISRTPYAGRGYTHQSWLSEDQTLLFLDDELDEQYFGHNTQTRVWDVRNLDAPVILDTFTNTTTSIDHNLYVMGDRVYQANYRSGLRVLQINRDLSGSYNGLTEVGFFDIYPSSDSANFNGAWSNYPYFPSGTIVVSGIEQGLFVLKLSLACGNDVIDNGEVCDGAELAGETCESQGCIGGTLTCDTTCGGFDTSGCTGCPEPVCNNNGICEGGEDCNTCPDDCVGGTSSGAECGNGICEAGNGEDCVSCPSDCNGKQNGKPANRFCCGDGDGENPLSCSDASCSTGGWQCTDVAVEGGPYCCGDSTCEGGEDSNICPIDCPVPFCGDGNCDLSEDSCSCAPDCGNQLGTEVGLCTDGIDNDCDEATDCNDDDCLGDSACQCAPVGESCTDDANCCSNKCTGKPGSKICK